MESLGERVEKLLVTVLVSPALTTACLSKKAGGTLLLAHSFRVTTWVWSLH